MFPKYFTAGKMSSRSIGKEQGAFDLAGRRRRFNLCEAIPRSLLRDGIVFARLDKVFAIVNPSGYHPLEILFQYFANHPSRRPGRAL
jgi:hypothetical protein